MKRVVLASGNLGKLREIQALAGDAFEPVPQSDFSVSEAEETGLSFIENALLKARHASQHTGLPALADDSGLEVDALNGAPGIHSARYAGPTASDRDNVDKLLHALADTPEHLRRARFQCVMVYLCHALDPMPIIAQGTWEGRSTKGWKESVSFKTIAGGSAVVETSFDAHPNETMLTVFHLDGEDLTLTQEFAHRQQLRRGRAERG